METSEQPVTKTNPAPCPRLAKLWLMGFLAACVLLAVHYLAMNLPLGTSELFLFALAIDLLVVTLLVGLPFRAEPKSFKLALLASGSCVAGILAFVLAWDLKTSLGLDVELTQWSKIASMPMWFSPIPLLLALLSWVGCAVDDRNSQQLDTRAKQGIRLSVLAVAGSCLILGPAWWCTALSFI